MQGFPEHTLGSLVIRSRLMDEVKLVAAPKAVESAPPSRRTRGAGGQDLRPMDDAEGLHGARAEWGIHRAGSRQARAEASESGGASPGGTERYRPRKASLGIGTVPRRTPTASPYLGSRTAVCPGFSSS